MGASRQRQDNSGEDPGPEYVEADFVFFSAVLSGVKEIREIVAKAKDKRKNKDNVQDHFVR